jgi:hypothetical protein
LSLYDYTGNWPSPYSEAGYEVIQVDLKHGDDARLWPSPPSDHARLPRDFVDIRQYVGQVHGILAAPVCTYQANCGAKHPRTDAQILESLSMVDSVVRLAWVLKPDFWVLENPIGKLPRWLGNPRFTFQPADYGDPYTKSTCLWGEFVPPLPLFVGADMSVEATEGSKMWARYGGKSERTKTLRSETPMGFARAFKEANP